MQERVYIVQTHVFDTSCCDQWLEAVSLWHMGKHITKRHRQSSWSMEKEVTCNHEGKMRSLTFAKLKPALFRANTLHNRLFSETPTVYRGKHVVSRHFCHSCLKANKVSKSERMRKVEYAYHFWKCDNYVEWKLSKFVHACQNYSLPKLAHFWDIVYRTEDHTQSFDSPRASPVQ